MLSCFLINDTHSRLNMGNHQNFHWPTAIYILLEDWFFHQCKFSIRIFVSAIVSPSLSFAYCKLTSRISIMKFGAAKPLFVVGETEAIPSLFNCSQKWYPNSFLLTLQTQLCNLGRNLLSYSYHYNRAAILLNVTTKNTINFTTNNTLN